jgi:hypothetical protein
MKHSPHQTFHQAFQADCLRDWYASPKGSMYSNICTALNSAPCAPCDSTLPSGAGSDRTGGPRVNPGRPGRSGWVPEQCRPAGRSRIACRWPRRFFSCVLVAHIGIASDSAVAVITEAARVLAPEGHLLLLEITGCPSGKRGGSAPDSRARSGCSAASIASGWKQAGLDVQHQRALSLLPGRLDPIPSIAPSGSYRCAAWRPWLPLLGNCVLTLARRRDAIAAVAQGCAPALVATLTVRAGGTSQWA